MSAGPGMPRGMLRGCQHHVATLEKYPIILSVVFSAFVAVSRATFYLWVVACRPLYKRNWWQVPKEDKTEMRSDE